MAITVQARERGVVLSFSYSSQIRMVLHPPIKPLIPCRTSTSLAVRSFRELTRARARDLEWSRGRNHRSRQRLRHTTCAPRLRPSVRPRLCPPPTAQLTLSVKCQSPLHFANWSGGGGVTEREKILRDLYKIALSLSFKLFKHARNALLPPSLWSICPPNISPT